MSTIASIKKELAVTGIELPIGATKDTLMALYSTVFPTVESASEIAREWDSAMRQNKKKRVMLIDAIAYTFTHKSEAEGVALATAILSNLGNENGRILKKELCSKGKKFQSYHGLVFAVDLENQPKADPNKDKPWAQCHPAGTSIWNDKLLVIKTAVSIKKVEKPAGSGETEAAKKEREAETGSNDTETGSNDTETGSNDTETGSNDTETGSNDTVEPDASPKGQQESDEVIALREKAQAVTSINEALDVLAGDWRALMLVYNNVSDYIGRLSDEDKKLMEQASS